MNDISTDSPTAAAVPLEGGTVPKMQVRGVSKRFVTKRGEVQALAECDLSIAEGEFVTIVGPSGCGKSTLMMIAAGLEDATTGEILVDGKVAGQPGPNRSVVFQKFALFPSQTVFHNIEFGLKVARVPKAERERRVDAQLALMGLKKFRNSYPHELSGGMQQRVAIARALAPSPSVLIADEPTGNLDTETGRQIADLLFSKQTERGMTMLLVTHDNALAARCSRQIRVRSGEIVGDSASSAARDHTTAQAVSA